MYCIEDKVSANFSNSKCLNIKLKHLSMEKHFHILILYYIYPKQDKHKQIMKLHDY